FIECKLIDQSLKLRIYDAKEIEKYSIKLSDAMVQILRNIHDYQNNEMVKELDSKPLKNCFGLIIAHDDYYYNFDTIKKLALQKSQLKNYNFDEDFINSHINFLSITKFETILNSSSIPF